MYIQDYLLCILYMLLIIVHSFTLCQGDFHRTLISIFSFALILKTISTIMVAAHRLLTVHGQEWTHAISIDLSPLYNVHYFAQLIHTISINFFILFLLIVAKGWPITRKTMPFKYAFALFWLICLAAELVTFYWTAITILTKTFLSESNGDVAAAVIPQGNNLTSLLITDQTKQIINPLQVSDVNSTTAIIKGTSQLSQTTTVNPFIAANQNLPNDSEQFNSTPRRLSLLTRVIVMLYFLLELRTTMILEQEQKKLQFYLHFGALSMVWFVHSVIVYVISLRVELVWQSKLITGFTSAADFLAFAVTTRMLWHKSSRSYLFKKSKPKTRLTKDELDDEELQLSQRETAL